MNSQQMKAAIKKFRAADVSIIKDEALRAKAQTLQAKQKGFTLLELLVVITLLATLATAALVAYDGIGENARDASAATALTTLEGTLRNYRVIEGEYPEQFDSLANADATATDASGALQLIAPDTKAFFGQLTIPQANASVTTGGTLTDAIADSIREAGLEELQAVQGATTWNTGFVPNLAMNESYSEVSANPGSELGFPVDKTAGAITYAGVAVTSDVALSIVPSGGNGTDGCGVFAAGDLQKPFFDVAADGTTSAATALTDNARLNLISDGLDGDGCNLVIAVGVGKEVPGATLGKSVEIGQVPTVGTNNVNPKDSYARAIALFLVATDDENTGTPGTIEIGEVLPKARLIALVDPEGRTIDQVVAAATAESEDN
jgi:prepilin-type N-terminal cleavage/methylation domain-containing protein